MKGIIAKNKKPVLTSDLPMPKAKKGEVLVRVKAASVNPTDLDLIEGAFGFLTKLLGPTGPVKSGLEFSGVIETDGVIFKKGDQVYGYINLVSGEKTHQEYISISEDYIAKMPSSLDYQSAASVPVGALTSFVAIYETVNILESTNVLVNGASGGLGVYALQFLKLIGAKVTTFDGPGKDNFLKSLGADEVFNYKVQDIRKLSGQYDVILDLSTQLKLDEISHLLKDRGIFIPLDPFKNIFDFIKSMLFSKKAKWLMVDKGDREKLTAISTLIDEGKLKPFVDSVYKLDEYELAFKRLSTKGKIGRIVMTL